MALIGEPEEKNGLERKDLLTELTGGKTPKQNPKALYWIAAIIFAVGILILCLDSPDSSDSHPAEAAQEMVLSVEME